MKQLKQIKIKSLISLLLVIPFVISSGNNILNKKNFKKSSEFITGVASYYHNKFNGRRTSNGEIFNNKNLTAAHKTLPLGTWVKVTNLNNDSVVIVKINDRLPKNSKRTN